MIIFSIIVPVYNRPDEIKELLESLSKQTLKNFELIVVEDGKGDSEPIIEEYKELIPIQYFYLKDTSVCFRRNYGAKNARSDYYIFLDSDCIIPPDYFSKLQVASQKERFDAYGGKDCAAKDFTPFQKAVNYAMTSFLTTGGIRGNKKKIDKFYPRSFNMGFNKEVFLKTGGFPEDMQPPGEDMVLSIRIHECGFNVYSEPDLYVYHKRKISFMRFWRQIHSFAYARYKISCMYPDTFKIFYLLPICFVAYTILALILALFITIIPLLFLTLYVLLIFVDALIKERSLRVAIISITTSLIQFTAYGIGFTQAFWDNFILRKK